MRAAESECARAIDGRNRQRLLFPLCWVLALCACGNQADRAAQDLSRRIVVLLTRPYMGRISNERQWKNFAHESNLVTAEISVGEKVPLVDVYSHFKGQLGYFADESHFTVAGHR